MRRQITGGLDRVHYLYSHDNHARLEASGEMVQPLVPHRATPIVDAWHTEVNNIALPRLIHIHEIHKRHVRLLTLVLRFIH